MTHKLTSSLAIMYMVIAFTIITILTGCTDASVSRVTSLGNAHTVQLINCDGSITHEWVSTGQVGSFKHSDGYYFTDAETGALIEVSGNVIISTVNH